MRTADEWNCIFKNIFASCPAVHRPPESTMIEFIKRIQEDALLHAERLAENVGVHLRQDNPNTGEPNAGTPEMAEGAFKAASRICLEVYNLRAGSDQGCPPRKDDSSSLAPLKPSCSGSESL